MCLGTALIHRISRIVVACPDPNGGCAGIDFNSIGSFYTRWKPIVEMGLFAEQSHDLIMAFLRTGKFSSWQIMLKEFAEMRAGWE